VEQILETSGKLDEHLSVQLAMLVYQRHADSHRTNYKGSPLSNLSYQVSRHFYHLSF
jgi:hypothetical protein